MDIEEMKVYIETLEKENAILKERNDKLYEVNCNQSRIISNAFGDVAGRYKHMVQYDDFGAAKRVYNQVTLTNTTNTTLSSTLGISYI